MEDMTYFYFWYGLMAVFCHCCACNFITGYCSFNKASTSVGVLFFPLPLECTLSHMI